MAFNILVVDDSETMRAVIIRTIGMTGIEIGTMFQAGNGKEALEILDLDWVDVILSDINMPEMGGVELLKAIKDDEVLSNIPVIFISTESSQTRMQEAEDLGVAAYIKKPFMPETIKVILLDVLSKAYASRMEEVVSEGGDDPDDDMDF